MACGRCAGQGIQRHERAKRRKTDKTPQQPTQQPPHIASTHPTSAARGYRAPQPEFPTAPPCDPAPPHHNYDPATRRSATTPRRQGATTRAPHQQTPDARPTRDRNAAEERPASQPAARTTPRHTERLIWTAHIWGRRHYHRLDYICIDRRSQTGRMHGQCAEVPALKSDPRWIGETLHLPEPRWAPDEHKRRARPKPIRWRFDETQTELRYMEPDLGPHRRHRSLATAERPRQVHRAGSAGGGNGRRQHTNTTRAHEATRQDPAGEGDSQRRYVLQHAPQGGWGKRDTEPPKHPMRFLTTPEGALYESWKIAEAATQYYGELSTTTSTTHDDTDPYAVSKTQPQRHLDKPQCDAGERTWTGQQVLDAFDACPKNRTCGTEMNGRCVAHRAAQQCECAPNHHMGLQRAPAARPTSRPPAADDAGRPRHPRHLLGRHRAPDDARADAPSAAVCGSERASRMCTSRPHQDGDLPPLAGGPEHAGLDRARHAQSRAHRWRLRAPRHGNSECLARPCTCTAGGEGADTPADQPRSDGAKPTDPRRTDAGRSETARRLGIGGGEFVAKRNTIRKNSSCCGRSPFRKYRPQRTASCRQWSHTIAWATKR